MKAQLSALSASPKETSGLSDGQVCEREKSSRSLRLDLTFSNMISSDNSYRSTVRDLPQQYRNKLTSVVDCMSDKLQCDINRDGMEGAISLMTSRTSRLSTRTSKAFRSISILSQDASNVSYTSEHN